MEIIKPDIKKAAKALKEGKVLICPTDTVYGLVCDYGNKKALERLFKIKKREKEKQVPVFVKDVEYAKKLVKVDKRQEELLKKVWPGQVTAVLKGKKGGTLGLRIPKYEFINELLKETSLPLTGTSANVSGNAPSTRFKEVVSQFEDLKPDMAFDAGNLKESEPSTVIDLTICPPKILRL